MSTFCTECGNVLAVGQVSCEKCKASGAAEGVATAAIPASPQTVQQRAEAAMPSSAAPTMPVKPPVKSRKIAGIASLAAMVLVGTSGGMFWHYRLAPSSADSATQKIAAVRTSASSQSNAAISRNSTTTTKQVSLIPPSSPSSSSAQAATTSAAAVENSPSSDLAAINAATGLLASDPDNEGTPLEENVAANEAAAKAQVCSVVSKTDIEQILGKPVREIVATNASCQYRTNFEHFVEIESTWKGGKEAMAAAKIYNAGLFSAIPRLGDESYFQAAGITHVRKGDVYFVINARAYQNSKETEVKIAQKLVEHISASKLAL
jgi:hypothetical protein